MKTEFPIIKNMLGAYLHQDFDLEFDSANEAISVFSMHAEKHDIASALVEINVLLGKGLNEDQLRSVIFDGLGCYYFYPDEWSDGASWLKHIECLLKKGVD